MPTNIAVFKNFVEYCSNKSQSGSATPAEFNLAANRAQMEMFERDYKVFLATKKISNFLSTFLKERDLAIDSFGNAPLPDDFQHTASMRSFYVTKGEAKKIPVTEDNNLDWGKIDISQLFKGNKRFPKYSEFGSNFRFLPRDLGIAYLDYFSTPVAPIWNFDVVNNAEVYNPIGSVDFSWDEYALNEVAGIYLSLIGINLKDSEIASFAQMFKQENA